MENQKAQPLGKGVRHLKLVDIKPDCEIFINEQIFDIKDVCKNKRVVDIGCGFGRNKAIVESVGGEWVGVEPFEGGAHTVIGDAEDLPFENNSFDVVIMDAVLEHIPDVSKAFKEVARVLRPNGVFVGYSAFMECFHEISYSHLSFRALEHYSNINGLKLEKISGGGRFGIDYHTYVLLYPLPFQYLRPLVAWKIRAIFKIKSWLVYCAVRFVRKQSHIESSAMAKLYYQIECLRQSNGYSFVIRKL